MPEGDTIHTLVRAMAPRLESAAVERLLVRSHGPVDSLTGRRIERVEARGKHLLVHIGPAVLHVHLGMHGAWHRYRHGEPWQRSKEAAHVVLATGHDVFGCFAPSQAEVVRRDALPRHPQLSTLGPDLLADAPDWPTVVERARARPGRALGEVLLDQRVAAGAGNVYKNEVLFLARLDPDTRTGDLTDRELIELYQLARKLMQDNLGRVPRITRPLPRPTGRLPANQRTWVYGRHDRPCFRCGTIIRCTPADRLTWWCPTCQT